MTNTLPAPTLTEPAEFVAAETLIAPRAALGTILVTGGASGLGAATVAAVRAAGGSPLVLDRTSPSDGRALPAGRPGRLGGGGGGRRRDRGGQRRPPRRRVHRRRHRLVRTARRGLRRRLGAGDPGQPDRHRLRRAGRAAAPAAQLRPGRDLRVHPRHQGRRRRHRVLRLEVRGRGLHPGARRRDRRRGRASPCSSRAACTRRSSTAGPSSTSHRPTPSSTQPADVAAAVVFALGQPAGCEIRELVVCCSTESSWP